VCNLLGCRRFLKSVVMFSSCTLCTLRLSSSFVEREHRLFRFSSSSLPRWRAWDSGFLSGGGRWDRGRSYCVFVFLVIFPLGVVDCIQKPVFLAKLCVAVLRQEIKKHVTARSYVYLGEGEGRDGDLTNTSIHFCQLGCCLTVPCIQTHAISLHSVELLHSNTCHLSFISCLCFRSCSCGKIPGGTKDTLIMGHCVAAYYTQHARYFGPEHAPKPAASLSFSFIPLICSPAVLSN
jgi:hypothetical protein